MNDLSLPCKGDRQSASTSDDFRGWPSTSARWPRPRLKILRTSSRFDSAARRGSRRRRAVDAARLSRRGDGVPAARGAHAKAPLATPCVTVHQLNTSLEDPQVFGQRHLVLGIHKNQILDEEQAHHVLPLPRIHRHPRKAVVEDVSDDGE